MDWELPKPALHSDSVTHTRPIYSGVIGKALLGANRKRVKSHCSSQPQQGERERAGAHVVFFLYYLRGLFVHHSWSQGVMLIQMMNRHWSFPWYWREKKKVSKLTEPGLVRSLQRLEKSLLLPNLKEVCSLLHQDIPFSMFADESSRQWFVFSPLGRKYKAARIQKSKERGVRFLMLLWVVVTVSMRSRFGPTNLSWVGNIMTQGSQVFVHSLLNSHSHSVTAYLSSKSVWRFLSWFGISLRQTQGQLF